MSYFFLVIVTLALIVATHLVIELEVQKNKKQPLKKRRRISSDAFATAEAVSSDTAIEEVDYGKMMNDLQTWVQTEKTLHDDQARAGPISTPPPPPSSSVVGPQPVDGWDLGGSFAPL